MNVCPTKCMVPTVGRHDPLKYMIISVKNLARKELIRLECDKSAYLVWIRGSVPRALCSWGSWSLLRGMGYVTYGGSCKYCAKKPIQVWHSKVIVLVFYGSTVYVHVHIQRYTGLLFLMYVVTVDAADIVVWTTSQWSLDVYICKNYLHLFLIQELISILYCVFCVQVFRFAIDSCACLHHTV